MITLEDCAAFCDADPRWVHEMACRDAMPLISAYACAHAATVSANDEAMLIRPLVLEVVAERERRLG